MALDGNVLDCCDDDTVERITDEDDDTIPGAATTKDTSTEYLT